MKLSVIIPSYNEINTIEEILSRVRRVDIPKEIIIVDDCSTDGTREFLKALPPDPNLRILFQPENMGKGSALKVGFKAASGDVVIIQDADLEYDPSEYPKLLEPILDGRADVVYGSRFTGSPRRVLFFWHTVGNKLLTFLSNACTDLNLTDMETGYKVFKREVLSHIQLKSNRFGFEPEVTAKIAKMNYRIYEVPISYSGRDYWEGKKIKWTDGVKCIVAILWYNFFDFEREDVVYQSLQRLKKSYRHNRWIFTKFKPFLGRRVLEIGSGTGNITKFLVGRDVVVATDIEPRYLDVLKNTFRHHKKMIVEEFDVSHPETKQFQKHEIDTVVALNVLEHVEHDETALRNIFDILQPGGRLLLLTPSHPLLYGSLDQSLGHRRRYRKPDLRKKLEAAGFAVERMRYFNRFAAAGWYLNGRIFRRKNLPPLQLSFYNLLIPFFKIEGLFPLPFGTSLIVVAEKPKEWKPSSISQNS